MSISTDEEVDSFFKKTGMDSLPVTSRSSPKSGLASGMAPSHQNDFSLTGPTETAPSNATLPTQEHTGDTDRLVKVINEVQAEVTSARRSMEDLKTNFEEELDLLAESVSAFTSRISEVDALKLEVKTLKRRLQRLEQGNSSTRSPHTLNDMTEESAKHSRLAKVASMVGRKPKATGPAAAGLGRGALTASKESNTPDQAASKTLDSPDQLGVTKHPLKSFPATRINQQVHQDTGSQSSSSDTESDLSPIPATRPGVARFPSPSSISGASAVALEFEPRPATIQSAKSRKTGSAASLKAHEVIPSSDIEDEEYKPQARRSGKPSLGRRGLVPSRGAHRAGRPRNPGSRTPNPGLEPPDWDRKPNTPWSRKRGIVRRGVSGRVWSVRSEPKRRASASLVEVTFPADGQRVDPKGRPLNEAGIPLRPDGKPDRRYLKKTIRDKTGILRYATYEPGPTQSLALLDDDVLQTGADEIEPNGEQSALLDDGLQVDAADESGLAEKPSLPDEAPQTSLKRAHSEGRVSVDELETPPTKKPRDDDTEVREEDMAELGWRWGIRQQSA